jgi:hypothetical protein
MIFGVVLNIISAILISDQYSEFPAVKVVLSIFIIISIVGLIISAFSGIKTGPLLVIIGAIAFVPIGLVAGFGARKILDQIKIDEFNKSKLPADNLTTKYH